MPKTDKLEKVLDLLIAEQQEQASELLHQYIVETSRSIYESIVNDEEQDEYDVDQDDEELTEADNADTDGVDDTEDFTAEIEADSDDIETDEQNGGKANGDEDDSDADADADADIDDRVEDLESQLDALRAEFNALMGQELQEPEHADLPDEIEAAKKDSEDGEDKDEDLTTFNFDEPGARPPVYEKKKQPKLEVAPQTKKGKGNDVAEATKFLNDVGDTGQASGNPKLVGTGDKSKLGSTTTDSLLTKAPSKPDLGGAPIKAKAQGDGVPGSYNGERPEKISRYDNQNPKPKAATVRGAEKAKLVGGGSAGNTDGKSPLTHKPK